MIADLGSCQKKKVLRQVRGEKTCTSATERDNARHHSQFFAGIRKQLSLDTACKPTAVHIFQPDEYKIFFPHTRASSRGLKNREIHVQW